MNIDKILVVIVGFLIFPIILLTLSIVFSFLAWEVFIFAALLWRMSVVFGIGLAILFWFITDSQGNLIKKEENNE